MLSIGSLILAAAVSLGSTGSTLCESYSMTLVADNPYTGQETATFGSIVYMDFISNPYWDILVIYPEPFDGEKVFPIRKEYVYDWYRDTNSCDFYLRYDSDGIMSDNFEGPPT